MEQLNLGDKRDAFLATLKCSLRKLKGWSETQTMKWVKQRNLIDALEGGFFSGPVYSHGPVQEALLVILDKKTNEAAIAAGNHIIDFRNAVLSVIYDAVPKKGSPGYPHLDRIKNYDWKGVKAKMAKVIKNYCRVKQKSKRAILE